MTRCLRALALLALLPAAALAQSRPHTIQGRVTSDSGGTPIANADVIVTIAPSAETVLGKSEANGSFRIAIANPTGEYILNVSALGFRSFRQRVTIPAGDTIATVVGPLPIVLLSGLLVALARWLDWRRRRPAAFTADDAVIET